MYEVDLKVGEIIRIPSAASPFGDLRYRVSEITEGRIKLEIIKDVSVV